MTQEEKDLVLCDLCGRLPYGVKFRTLGGEFPFTLKWIDDIYRLNGDVKLENAKVFLRPMSSMTEEEYNSIKSIIGDHRITFHAGGVFTLDKIKTFKIELIDWLNSHHFDFRGLIPRGLAISTDEFNPYKD